MVPAEIEDFLCSGYWDIATERVATRKACAEVLSRLPDDVVEQIVYRQKIILLAPGKDWGRALPYSLLGEIRASPTMHVSVTREGGTHELERSVKHAEVQFALVYLAPQLERQDYPVIVATVAHEVAHGISRQIDGEESERLADQMIGEWRFGRELQALRATNPRHRF
jgi:hypothetical protein